MAEEKRKKEYNETQCKCADYCRNRNERTQIYILLQKTDYCRTMDERTSYIDIYLYLSEAQTHQNGTPVAHLCLYLPLRRQ